jgi:hypothetical protein
MEFIREYETVGTEKSVGVTSQRVKPAATQFCPFYERRLLLGYDQLCWTIPCKSIVTIADLPKATVCSYQCSFSVIGRHYVELAYECDFFLH